MPVCDERAEVLDVLRDDAAPTLCSPRGLSNRSRVNDTEFNRLVRNVYKVLLTRGMVGTVLASVDAETQQMLTELVPAPAFLDASGQRGVAASRA